MTPDEMAKPIDLASAEDFVVGRLQVRPSLREIEDDGTITTLEPRVMQVLVLLSEMHGRTVPRDLLVERCWGGVVVGEDAIQRCISRLRKIAEATAAFEIITLSRVGYRLAPCERADASPGQDCLLAVLPFDNLSGDPEFDYFADGVSEEILQSIARSSPIRVIGRTSSFQYRGQHKQIGRIAKELGATHVLDGSVRRSSDMLRVSAQFTEIADHSLLWSDRFDGSVANPFDLQDAVARGTVAALHGIFVEPANTPHPSGAAFDALLRLRHLFNNQGFGGDDEEVIRAVEMLSPDSAEAWGIVAKVRAAQRWTAGPEREADLRAAASLAARRALAVDPNNGAAHKALFMLEPPAGRFAEREETLEHARQSRPEDSEILWSLYLHYLSVGRLGLSAQMAEEAYRRDPLRPLNMIAYANSLYTAGLPNQALALMNHAIDRWPHDATVFAITIWTAAVENEHAFAKALLAGDWRDRYPDGSRPLVERAAMITRGIIDDPEELREALLDELGAIAEAGGVNLGLLGLSAYLGSDLETVFDHADRMPVESLRSADAIVAPLEGTSHLFLRVNARLRQSPRFVTICQRLGLPDYWQGSGSWPDCADETAGFYDFRALCRSAMAASAHTAPQPATGA